MQSRKPSYILHKLKIGVQLRCPCCERGRVFQNRFTMYEKCLYCGCRFERSAGDAVGGIYLNIALAEFTALCGFVAVHLAFEPPILHQLAFWLIYILLFTTLFYRYARSMWLGVVYINGGIHPDLDCDQEYFAPETITLGKTPQEFE